MIKNTSNELHFNYILLNSCDTTIKEFKFHYNIYKYIYDIINKRKWNKIVTYNSDGEYGRPRYTPGF